MSFLSRVREGISNLRTTIADLIAPSQPRPERGEPERREPTRPRRKRIIRQPSPEEIWATTHAKEEEDRAVAQSIWDDVVADIVSNVEMEEPFIRFVMSHMDDEGFSRKDTRALISWFIIHANVIITSDDIEAILDRMFDGDSTGQIRMRG